MAEITATLFTFSKPDAAYAELAVSKAAAKATAHSRRRMEIPLSRIPCGQDHPRGENAKAGCDTLYIFYFAMMYNIFIYKIALYRLDLGGRRCDLYLMAQMLTANRLVDGTVVYWRDGRWVEALGEATIFATEAEGETARIAAQPFVTDNVVINPYLFDVRPDGTPVKEREIIRAAGPSIHDNLGKQAEGLTPDTVRRAAAARDVRSAPPKVKTEDNVSI